MSVYDTQDIVARLQADPLRVAERYAPGGYVRGAQYWALDPGRNDTRIGSFAVNVTGPHRGRWREFGLNEGGDMLDLIARATGKRGRDLYDEARAFLGMNNETPAQRELRARHARAAQLNRARQEADESRRRQDASRRAHAIWLSGQERLAGTPVADYLRHRAIGLDLLGRTPHVLRFHPALPYSDVDKETGKQVEGSWPAMLAAIHGPAVEGGKPAFWGLHRTWLARNPDGSVGKAPVPTPKKVLGQMKGGYIRVWAGSGPRGGKVPLSSAPPRARVFIAEGIEDALSVAVIRPQDWSIAAVSLGNMAEVALPAAIGHVTIVADRLHPDPETAKSQQALIDRAVARFRNEDRYVDVWHNNWGGKDLNDALMLAQQQEGAA